MRQLMNLKNLAVLVISVSLFASCFKKKPEIGRAHV